MTCLQKRLGQSMVELSFVVLAVIAGVVLGGPYLLDSLNSHFKLWDSAVSDSNNDRLIQANKNDVNLEGLTCDFISKAPGSCAAPECGGQTNIRYFTHQFNPQGCQTKFSCDADPTCCSEPVATAICWRVGDPANATRIWAQTSQIPADLIARGFKSCFPNGQACKNSDRLYTFICGDLGAMFIAKDDAQICMPNCNWGAIPPTAMACPNQGVRHLMERDQNPSLVLNCSANPGACEAHCGVDFKPSGDSCIGVCRNLDAVTVSGSPVLERVFGPYADPVQFEVDMWAEDFIYKYVLDGVIQKTNWTCTAKNTLTWIGYKDEPDGTIQHLQFITPPARSMYIHVSDGGRPDNSPGYSVKILTNCEDSVAPVAPHADYGALILDNPDPTCRNYLSPCELNPSLCGCPGNPACETRD